MKRILFPTDFSEAADNAFVHAIELANKVNGELILLHSFEFPIIDNQYFPENYQVIFDSIELSKFDKFKDEIAKLRSIIKERNLEHIKMSHRLMDGELINNIKIAIKEDKIDFVVMGTSGASGWKEIFVGTNTGEVLTSIDVPVLSVPLVAKYNKVETIGFTTRFREKDKVALRDVLKVAKKVKANVKCLYVKSSDSDVSETVINNWEKEFSDEPVQFFIIPGEEVKETIIDFITNQGIDILSMTTYKRNFFVELVTTHFAEKMLYISSIPILVMHE
jgi:nucleotide-binding universal stress UspA family protein